MKRIAVVTAPGLGDGLIFHIFSCNLVKSGFEIVTFNPHLSSFGSWLNGYQFANDDQLETFDALILQHDNSEKAKRIRTMRNVYCFYGSHQISKHGPLQPLDYVCNPSKTMVQNVQMAMRQWFGFDSIENGLKPPPHLIYRKYPNRIVIHPDSSSASKNWHRYEEVAASLIQIGYEPVFITKNNQPLFPKLEDLASFIYESGAFLGSDSGPGHLASSLNIPTVTISSCANHMLLWRPGWNSCVITPPYFVSHLKWLRNKWKTFISKDYVIKLLLNYINNYNKELEVKL
jgi:heptosyltransferase III